MQTTKPQRQALIRQILDSRAIRSQDELVAALRDEAVEVVQSTLSRDLTELNVRKKRGRYVPRHPSAVPDRFDLSPVVRGWTVCGPNLIVVHTSTGQASAVAVAIDEAGEPSLTGTLAGDDTILLATRNRTAQNAVIDHLTRWFGDKK